MKQHLLFVCMILALAMYPQTTLTQSFHEPQPGDTETMFRIDTSAYTNGLPLGVTGNNVNWDFSALNAIQPVLNSYYLDTLSVPDATNYPGCTTVNELSGSYTYFKSTNNPGEQTEILGMVINTITLTFTNSAIVAKYPVSYGSNFTDNISGTFIYTVNGTCNGSITFTADGQGTLNLPQGHTLSNVLRVKSVQNLNLSAVLFPGFPAAQVATIKQTVYRYYSQSQKFPVLSISYIGVSTLFSPTPTLTALVTGNTNYFVTGIGENVLSEDEITLYPNPAATSLHLNLNTHLHVQDVLLYNSLGQLVYQNSHNLVIDVSHLKSGLYTMEVRTDKGLVRKKIIKN